jgi:hypothetical protein
MTKWKTEATNEMEELKCISSGRVSQGFFLD